MPTYILSVQLKAKNELAAELELRENTGDYDFEIQELQTTD